MKAGRWLSLKHMWTHCHCEWPKMWKSETNILQTGSAERTFQRFRIILLISLLGGEEVEVQITKSSFFNMTVSGELPHVRAADFFSSSIKPTCGISPLLEVSVHIAVHNHQRYNNVSRQQSSESPSFSDRLLEMPPYIVSYHFYSAVGGSWSGIRTAFSICAKHKQPRSRTSLSRLSILITFPKGDC